jgi:branched-chain amino acid transport system permease protein
MTGAVLSAIYSILALGFSLIYGIAKQLKLSIGGYYVIAAYSMFFLLEARRIDPFLVVKDLDGFWLLLLALMPGILVLISLIIVWFKFPDRKQVIIILGATIIAIGSGILFKESLVESLYLGLAVLLICLTAWYLEFPRQKIALSTLLVAVSFPIFAILKTSIVYLALMIVAVIFTASIAMLSDRYLLDKVRHNHVNIMIFTFALALLFQSVVQLMYFPAGGVELLPFGPEDRSLLALVSTSRVVRIYGALILEIKIVALIFVIIAVISLYMFIWRSKMGIALRAVSQDEEAAALSGIDIRKTTAIVSGIGMGLIAFASVLTSPFAAIPHWSPHMGWGVLIIAIAIVTLGGLGSLPGSLIAAFIFGFAEVIISSIPAFAAWSGILPFIVVFIVMILKPEGLLGEKKELEA